MSALPQEERTYTIDDIYNLPEGKRAELIDGQIYNMAPPSRAHQKLSMKLSTIIDNYIDAHGGSCEVYHAPFAVFLNKDEKTYFEPDISVICDPNKLTDKGCNGAPDWIIEIISPSTYENDYGIKLKQYMAAGVKEYWIVNPKAETIFIFRSNTPDLILYRTFSDAVPSGIFEGFSIDFSQLDI
jgi:Uma2 family endonuclease